MFLYLYFLLCLSALRHETHLALGRFFFSPMMQIFLKTIVQKESKRQLLFSCDFPLARMSVSYCKLT